MSVLLESLNPLLQQLGVTLLHEENFANTCA